MGREAFTAEKQPCLNCREDIYLSEKGEYFHYQNGVGPFMSRCDGRSRSQDDDYTTEWARPSLRHSAVVKDGAAAVVGPFGNKVDHSSYTHPPVAKAVSPQRQLLLDAADTVDGERQDQYGNAEDSFAVIAGYWNTYLRVDAPGVTITAKDVALMMVLFKVAREGNSPKRDNILDGAGYFGLAQRIEEKS